MTVLINGVDKRSVTAGLTADVGQAQGGQALTAELNEISVCANANDSVTLPTAVAGLKVVIINNGAEQVAIFPASGDNLGAGVNNSVALAAGSSIVHEAYDSTSWKRI